MLDSASRTDRHQQADMRRASAGSFVYITAVSVTCCGALVPIEDGGRHVRTIFMVPPHAGQIQEGLGVLTTGDTARRTLSSTCSRWIRRLQFGCRIP